MSDDDDRSSISSSRLRLLLLRRRRRWWWYVDGGGGDDDDDDDDNDENNSSRCCCRRHKFQTSSVVFDFNTMALSRATICDQYKSFVITFSTSIEDVKEKKTQKKQCMCINKYMIIPFSYTTCIHVSCAVPLYRH